MPDTFLHGRLVDWLRNLAAETGALSVIHVGADADRDVDMYSGLDVAAVQFYDADQEAVRALVRAGTSVIQCRVHHELLADRDGEVEYFTLSYASESGLLDAGSLRPWRRNLTDVSKSSRRGVALDSHASSKEFAIGAGGRCLIIDCLPATQILHGGQRVLRGCDLVSLRVALDDNDIDSPYPIGHEAADRLLYAEGFRRVAVEPELLRTLGRAIYIRDHRRLLRLSEEKVLATQLQIEHLERAQREERSRSAESERLLAEALANQADERSTAAVLQAELSNELQSLKNDLAEGLKGRTALEARLSELVGQITMLRLGQDRIVTEHQFEMQQRELALTELQVEHNESREDRDRALALAKEAGEDRDRALAVAKEAAEALTAADRRHSATEDQLKYLRDELNGLQHVSEGHERAAARAIEERDALRVELIEAREALARAGGRADTAERQRLDALIAADASKSRTLELSRELDNARSTAEVGARELAASRTELAECLESLKAEQASSEVFARQLAEAQSRLANIQHEIERAEGQLGFVSEIFARRLDRLDS